MQIGTCMFLIVLLATSGILVAHQLSVDRESRLLKSTALPIPHAALDWRLIAAALILSIGAALIAQLAHSAGMERDGVLVWAGIGIVLFATGINIHRLRQIKIGAAISLVLGAVVVIGWWRVASATTDFELLINLSGLIGGAVLGPLTLLVVFAIPGAEDVISSGMRMQFLVATLLGIVATFSTYLSVRYHATSSRGRRRQESRTNSIRGYS